MKLYIITGVAGFIAARVAELLLEQGHQVIGIDNLNDYYNPDMKHWRLQKLTSRSGFRFHQYDIEDSACVDGIVRTESITAVIHLAARAGVRASVQEPGLYFRTNLIGTLNVLEACRRASIQKVVVASSSSVYGSHNTIPFREEADTSHPLSPYAASKKSIEELCYSYHHLHKLDISALRFFTVFGPAGRPDMSMFRFIRGIYEERPITVFGDGTQLRDFSYVDDIANGVIAALKPVGYRVFNLGASHPVELNLVINSIERLSNRLARKEHHAPDPSDVPATWADVSRAKAELGWCPRTELEAGIENSLAWYVDNREWAQHI